MSLLKTIQLFSIFLFAYVLFFNYAYFFLPALLLFYVGSFKFKFTHTQIKLLSFFPYLFYLLRYYSSISQKSDNIWIALSHPNYYLGARFLDLQQVLFSLKCNFDPINNFNLNFSNISKSCPWTANYGPLLEAIPYFGNIWRDTLILAFVTILLFLILYRNLINKFPEHNLIILILFLSPSTNFLIERMNIDIFVLLISTYVIYNYKKIPHFGSFILLTLSLIKIHPIGFLIGLVLYSLVSRDKKILSINLYASLAFFVLYSIGAYIQNKAFATEWRPDDPLVTFGIFSDANYLSKTFSPSVVTFYISIVLVLASIQFLFSWKNIKGLPTFNDKEKIFLYTYGTFFILNMLYANFDYRLPILIPLILLFAKSVSSKIYILSLLFIFLMPFGLPASIITSEIRFFLSNFFAIIGKLSLYFFLEVVFRVLYLDFRSLIKK